MLNSYSRMPQTIAAGSLNRQYSLKFLLVRRISDNSQREQNDGPPPSSKHSKLLGRALAPFVAKTSADLARELIKNVIMHVVGDILVVEKPFGVSSLGYIEKGHGIFGYSRDVLKERESPEYNKRHVKEPTLSDAIPHLKEHFQESGLHFCTGLKRWVSGPVILPCNPTAHKRIEHSLFQGSSIAHTTLEREAQHLYRALAICISRPKSDRGTVNGYAFLQKTEKAVEYIFAEGEINKRARRGNFASQGEITYEVLESKYGCSLVDLQFSKFSMHFPRVFLSYMGAPILGDDIYMRRLLQIDGKPTLIEPKDVGRGGSKYEPTEFLRLLGLNRLDQLKPKPPMFLAVYRTTLPFYGDTKPQRRVNELELTTPPPEHFLAMTDLLNFTPAVERLLNSLDQQEENNIDADAEPKTDEKNMNRKKKKKIKNVIDYSIK